MSRKVMNPRRFLRYSGLLLLIISAAGVFSAVAASNTVPFTRLDDDSFPITANGLKPSACGSLNLTNVVVISGNGSGTNGNDLLLGSTGGDNIRGRDGNDCIVGGGGGDNLDGQKDNDILLGGIGNDSLQGSQGDDLLYGEDGDDDFNGGKGTDVCDGGSGTDSGHKSCETEINIP